MKVIVSQTDLSQALAVAAGASSIRTALPVLASIRITTVDGGISLVGCDGEMWASATCAANVETPGAICVQQKLLSEVVNALSSSGQVSIELEGTQVLLRHGDSEWKMLSMNPDEFPEIPEIEGSSELILKRDELRHAIETVIYAVSDDTSRPVLTGVLFSYDGVTLTMVATDTHRMAVHRIRREGIGSQIEVVVPEKALKVIRNLDVENDVELNLSFDESRLSVDTGKAKVVAQLLHGQYPNWERVVPTEFTRTWTADRGELIDNVKRAMILARDNANRVRFSGLGDKIVITAKSEDKGEGKEEVSVVSKNGDLEIAFNGRYVMEALSALSGAGVRAEMTESSRPAVIRPTEDSEDTFCVVMPMAMG